MQPNVNQPSTSGIINLRFEDTEITTGAVIRLKEFLSKKLLLETLSFVNVTFTDSVQDFKKIMEGIQFNQKIRKLTFQGMIFDDESHGKSLGRCLSESKTIRELDI